MANLCKNRRSPSAASNLFALLATTYFLALTEALSHSKIQTTSNLELIAVGGFRSIANWTADVDIISIESNSHLSAASLPTSLYDFGSTIINDTIYVVGGAGGSTSGDGGPFLAYSISANTWTKLPNFPYNVADNIVVSSQGMLYSIGGFDSGPGIMDYAYKFDFNKYVWERLQLLPSSFASDGCIVADESNIYIVDGYGAVYRSSDGANTWVQRTSANNRRYKSACVILESGEIVVVGGESSDDEKAASNTIQIYNVTSDAWGTLASMTRGRTWAQAVVIPHSNDIVVCGGCDRSNNKIYDDCEQYSYKDNQWAFTKFVLNMPRCEYGLFVHQV